MRPQPRSQKRGDRQDNSHLASLRIKGLVASRPGPDGWAGWFHRPSIDTDLTRNVSNA
jgi:hypothetical protein